MATNFRFPDLAGRTVVYTGVVRGIGRATVPELLAQGLRVLAIDRDPAELQAARAEWGVAAAVECHACDLADPAAVAALGEALAVSSGPIDAVVHNAGIDPRHRFEMREPSPWDRVWQINLQAAVTLTQHLLPKLRASPAGRVVFTSSVMSALGGAHATAYAASKGALESLTLSLAHELQGTRVTVNCLRPGAITVEKEDVEGPEKLDALVDWQSVPRRLTPADLLGPLCLLLSEAGGGMTGQIITVDGGLVHPLMTHPVQAARLATDGYA